MAYPSNANSEHLRSLLMYERRTCIVNLKN
jgi:hypothetical protein